MRPTSPQAGAILALLTSGMGGSVLIYLDLVFLLNFLVDFLLILGTNRLTGFRPSPGRGALAAALGAAYAAVCLVPGFAFLGNLLWRSVSLGLMAAVSFGLNRSALQRGAVFVLLSMALGGIAMSADRNDFQMLILCAGLLWLLCRAGFRGSAGGREYVTVRLHRGEKSVSLIALKDTGNTLTDPLTGEQVLIAGPDAGRELLGLTQQQLRQPAETLASGKIPGSRLVPYRAVGQPGGMLLAVRFRGAKIGDQFADPLVAFAPEEIGRGDVYQMLTGGAI